MVRTACIILGIGLAILGIAGLSAGSTSWLVWLDFAVAVASFVVAGSIRSTTAARARARAGRAGGPAILAGALLVMWIIGLNDINTLIWMDWWNFFFAAAFGIVAIAAAVQERRRPASATRREEPPRRVA